MTPETRRLLQHWRHHQFGEIRPFFCQVEAVETAIWLTEVAPGDRHHRPAPARVASVQLGAPRVESDPLNFESKAGAPLRPAVVEPLAPTRYQVRFTASAELREKLERLQAFMCSSVPDGDLARIIDIAITEKLQRVEARRFAKTEAPRRGLVETDTLPSSRHIPAAVRRAAHDRDSGRCTRSLAVATTVPPISL